MTELQDLDELLRASDGDEGCGAGAEILDTYVELELTGHDPAHAYPGMAIHLMSCPACRTEHEGLLETARQFADMGPE